MGLRQDLSDCAQTADLVPHNQNRSRLYRIFGSGTESETSDDVSKTAFKTILSSAEIMAATLVR